MHREIRPGARPRELGVPRTRRRAEPTLPPGAARPGGSGSPAGRDAFPGPRSGRPHRFPVVRPGAEQPQAERGPRGVEGEQAQFVPGDRVSMATSAPAPATRTASHQVPTIPERRRPRARGTDPTISRRKPRRNSQNNASRGVPVVTPVARKQTANTVTRPAPARLRARPIRPAPDSGTPPKPWMATPSAAVPTAKPPMNRTKTGMSDTDPSGRCTFRTSSIATDTNIRTPAIRAAAPVRRSTVAVRSDIGSPRDSRTPGGVDRASLVSRPAPRRRPHG